MGRKRRTETDDFPGTDEFLFRAKSAAAAAGGLEGTHDGAMRAAMRTAIMSLKDVNEALADGTLDKDAIEKSLGFALKATNQEAPTQTLKLASGEVVFKEVSIPPQELRSTTVVSNLNPRNQDVLKLQDVSDIIATLDGKTQASPAYAFIDGDGKIAIVDGSRRRLANLNCINPPNFNVLVADAPLTEDDVFELCRIVDTKLEHTAYEQGKTWIQYKDRKKIATLAELAKALDKPFSTVVLYCRLANVSANFLNLAPFPAQLGVKLLTKLDKMQSDINPEDFNSFVLYRDRVMSENSESFSRLLPIAVNIRVVGLLEKELSRLNRFVSSDVNKFVSVVDLASKNQKIRVKDVFDQKQKQTTINFEIKGLPKLVGELLKKDIADLILARMKEEGLIAK
jgi:hypothetical protein